MVLIADDINPTLNYFQYNNYLITNNKKINIFKGI